MNFELPPDDAVRRVVPATQITYIEGKLALNARGLVSLCNAIIEGRIEGNKEKAARFRERVQKEFKSWL